jgi:hypothetical protein
MSYNIPIPSYEPAQYTSMNDRYRNPHHELFEALKSGQYQSAVEYINGHHYELHSLTNQDFLLGEEANHYGVTLPLVADPNFRRALILYADSYVLYKFGLDYKNQYPEMLETWLQQHRFNDVDDPDIMMMINDTINDGGHGDVADNENNLMIKLMLDYGMDPNSVIYDKSLFLTAFDANNYQVMSYIAQNPRFNPSPDYLTYINEKVSLLDQIRESLISRFRPTAQSRKRTRYTFDE